MESPKITGPSGFDAGTEEFFEYFDAEERARQREEELRRELENLRRAQSELEAERSALRLERAEYERARMDIQREREEEKEEIRELRKELQRALKREREQGAPNDEEEMIPQAEESEDSDDNTQYLPPPDPIFIEQRDPDEEIDIEEGPEPRVHEPGIEQDAEFIRGRFIFGANMYEIDEDNADFVKRAMLLEITNYVNNGNPAFMMVRVRNEHKPYDLQYYGIRFTLGNLNFLINTVKEPWTAWENYRTETSNVPSDLVEKLISFEYGKTGWYKVTHLAFYNPDINANMFNPLGQRIDHEILKRLYDMFPDQSFVRMEEDEDGNLVRRRTRHGRFMAFKMDFEALKNSNCPAAIFWKNYPDKAKLEKEFQIPWFSVSQNLLKEEEDSPVDSEIYSTPCFLYALKSQIGESLYEQIRNMQEIHGCGVKTSIFKKLQENYCRIAFRVYRVYKEENLYKINYDRYPTICKKRPKESDTWPEIKLMFWENHYMCYKDVLYNGREQCFLRVLEDSKRNGLLIPYNGFEYARLYDNYAYDEMLHFDDKLLIKRMYNGQSFMNDIERVEYKDKKFIRDIWFADFEATTNEEFHRPFLIVTKGVHITTRVGELQYAPLTIDGKSTFYFWGPDCESAYLDFMLKKYGKTCGKRKPDVRVYFYNLRYDFTFLLRKLYDVHKIIKGNKLYSVTGHYRDGHKNLYIDFWDALPLFQCSLKTATESYLTPEQKETIQKEIFPYSLYTYDLFETYPNGWCPLELFLTHLKEDELEKLYDIHTREHQNFIKFTLKEPEKMINFKEYAIFYCTQDVNCLSQIMINFATLLSGNGLDGINGAPPFNLNLWKYRTASSIGYDYFNRTVMFTENIETKEIVPRFDWAYPKCALRALIQKTIRGGRVMVRDNKPFHYVATNPTNYLMDYDGVSLYPSAMSLLWVTDGGAELIKSERDYYTTDHFKAWFVDPESKDLDKPFKDGCIHLKFLHVDRHLHFPMLCIKDPKTKLNNYTNFNVACDTWVNTIDLYNLIEFQGAYFEFDAAVVWRGERHFEIQDSIQNLFEFRKNNKKHPIQLVTKLMMNSIFGKSILKPSGKQKKVIDKIRYRRNRLDNDWYKVDNWGEFFRANMYRIHRFEDLGDKVEVEVYKRDVSCSLNIFGSNVLAMARRIIGRVMSLAEELEQTHLRMQPGIFYTDTDSFHIRKDLLEILEAEYLQRYGKELKGSELTQFHVDFDIPKNFQEGETVVGAVESYFIMKKIYVDKLLGSKGSIGYHMRMKGIPTDLVKFSDYEKIFNGESVVFDLLDGHTSFFYKDGHVGSRLVMTREIMTKETRELRKQNKKLKVK